MIGSTKFCDVRRRARPLYRCSLWSQRALPFIFPSVMHLLARGSSYLKTTRFRTKWTHVRSVVRRGGLRNHLQRFTSPESRVKPGSTTFPPSHKFEKNSASSNSWGQSPYYRPRGAFHPRPASRLLAFLETASEPEFPSLFFGPKIARSRVSPNSCADLVSFYAALALREHAS